MGDFAAAAGVPMFPSAVIWDVGGTLVDYALDPDELLDRALRHAGLSRHQLSQEAILAAREESQRQYLCWRTLAEEREGFRQLALMMLQGSGVAANPDMAERLGQGLASYFDRYRPVPDVIDLLAELASRGIRQAVVSNWPPSLPAFLDHHGLKRYLAVIVASGEEGILKPDPSLFSAALERLAAAAAEAISVGDNPENDVAPARQIGMQAVHFNPRGEYERADARDVAALRAILFDRLGLRLRA